MFKPLFELTIGVACLAIFSTLLLVSINSGGWILPYVVVYGSITALSVMLIVISVVKFTEKHNG